MLDLLIKLQINTDKVKIQKVVYNKRKNSLSVFLLFKDTFEKENEEKIIKKLQDEFNVDVHIFTKKSILDIDVINYIIRNFIKNKYSNLFGFIQMQDIKVAVNETPKIVLQLPKDLKDVFTKNSFISDLHKELDENFFEKFIITIEEKAVEFNDEEILKSREANFETEFYEPEKGHFNVLGCESYIGDTNLFTRVSAIQDINMSAETNVCCGKIKYLTKRSFEKATKTGNKTKEYYTFVLDDGKSNIACSYFCSESNKPKMDKLVDGDKIVVVGKVDIFRDKPSMKPKSILLCEDFAYVESKKVYSGESEKYKLIFPKPFIELKQVNLLDVDINKTANYLQNKTFVVFDVETTGLDFSVSEMIEIGAVKISDGKIVETFTSLLKPAKYDISKETEQITGITPIMVDKSPKFVDIVADLYKFCYGAELVAHNAEFDISFLRNQSNSANYFFDNKLLDTLELSRKHIRGVKNYKLKTLVDFLGITLEDAHRALNDALATAKLFIKLADYLN